MKPNIIKANNHSWIHDHKRVFMMVYSEEICTEGHLKMKDLRARLRKYKIRHRVVEQEYPGENNGIRMFWDFYIEMPYCRLPERFPERLLTSDCPEGSCPSNCYLKGIAALHHGKDGKGRSLPLGIRSINDIIFPRPTSEMSTAELIVNSPIYQSPVHPNTRCISTPINPANVQSIEIDVSSLFPSEISGVRVPEEVRERVLEEMRMNIENSSLNWHREFEHSDGSRERIEGIMRRTIEARIAQVFMERERAVAVTGTQANRLREIAHSAGSIGITYEELSDSMRALGRASNSLYGQIGSTPDPIVDIQYPSEPPSRGGDIHITWLDEDHQNCFLFGGYVDEIIITPVWRRISRDDFSIMRPARVQETFRELCGFEIYDVEMSRNEMLRNDCIDMEFASMGGLETLKVLIQPNGMISLLERTHSVPRDYRHPRSIATDTNSD